MQEDYEKPSRRIPNSSVAYRQPHEKIPDPVRFSDECE
jgi:hypothetical protein